MTMPGTPMRYLPARDGALMEWLRSELPGVVTVTAACRDADASGVALIEDAIGGSLEGGGRLQVSVGTARAATAARTGLEGPRRDVVVSVTGGDGPGVAAYVLSSADGFHRAYIGGTTWTGLRCRCLTRALDTHVTSTPGGLR